MKKSEKNIKKIEDILKGFQISQVLSQHDLMTIKQAMEVMRKQLEETKGKRENHKIWATNSDKRQVKEALNCLLRVAINEPITPILKSLVDELVILAAEWNKSISGEEEVGETISALQRFVDYHLSVVETVRALKGLLKRVEQVQRFTPAAFELSEHYLKSLQELKIDKKKPRNLKKRGIKKS